MRACPISKKKAYYFSPTPQPDPSTPPPHPRTPFFPRRKERVCVCVCVCVCVRARPPAVISRDYRFRDRTASPPPPPQTPDHLMDPRWTVWLYPTDPTTALQQPVLTVVLADHRLSLDGAHRVLPLQLNTAVVACIIYHYKFTRIHIYITHTHRSRFAYFLVCGYLTGWVLWLYCLLCNNSESCFFQKYHYYVTIIMVWKYTIYLGSYILLVLCRCLMIAISRVVVVRPKN